MVCSELSTKKSGNDRGHLVEGGDHGIWRTPVASSCLRRPAHGRAAKVVPMPTRREGITGAETSDVQYNAAAIGGGT